MRFMYNPYSIDMSWEEYESCILQIENTKAYVALISDLYSQTIMGEGESILSDGENCIDIKKYTELILEPFSIDMNNRKIKGRIYQELSVIAFQSYYSQYNNICSQLQGFMEQVFSDVPYSLTYNSSIAVEEILKVESVELDYTFESIAEKLCIYIRLLSSVCGVKTIFFADLNKYLNESDMANIYKEARYDKVSIINICTWDDNCAYNDVVRFILDDSMCFWKAQ